VIVAQDVDFEIPSTNSPPVIDGVKDAMYFRSPTQYTVKIYAGNQAPAESFASWNVLWDDEYLYFFTDVNDEALQNDSAEAWQDDSVELYIDGDNEKNPGPKTDDERQFTMGWDDDGDMRGHNQGDVSLHEFVTLDTDNGYAIEARFHWPSMTDTAPAVGNLIGIDAMTNDDDDGGDTRDVKLGTFSETEAWDDASQWGTARLVVGTLKTAQFDNPKNMATDVLRDTDLAWIAGNFAQTHNVYFGTSWDDVNNATTPDSAGQSDTTYDPGLLDYGQTYFWRVDEVNAPPDSTVFTGDVWSFTVEPFSIPVEDVSVTASSSNSDAMGPEKTIDGSGLNELDQHSTVATDMWLSAAEPAPWIQYEFDKVYKLDQLIVWNSNQVIEAFLGFGAKDVTIETSVDGAAWTALEGPIVFNQATSMDDYTANTAVGFGGVQARFVRITINAGYGVIPQWGLSEVRFLYIPTFAREPEPAGGSTMSSADVMLSWRSGREAASSEVYLGTDAADLALVATTSEAAHAANGLNYSTTYFWSVTEVNDAEAVSSYASDIWSFTTPDFGIVDNFDQYDDNCNRIFFAWEDGLGHSGSEEIDDCDVPASNGNGGGSMVGNDVAPFAERTIVNIGSAQSLPFNYDNAFGLSEATLAIPEQDWTASGIQTLALAYSGAPGNTGTLFVKINNAKVSYDGDPADIARGAWQARNIDLRAVGGLQNVTSLTLGVDGANAAGMLYFDDIRLYPLPGEFITPTQPNDTNLVAHYTFDEGAGTVVGDSSGNGNNGTVVGVPQWVAGKIGGAMLFSGFENHVDCGNDASLVLRDAVTVACWIKVAAFGVTWETIVSMGDDAYRMGRGPGDGDSIHFGSNGIDSGSHLNGTTVVTTDTWRHVAIVYDGTNKYIYIDGFVDAQKPATGQIDASSHNLYIAENAQATGRYLNGTVDDLRIYGRGLSAEEVAGLAGLTEPLHKPF